MIWKNKAKKRTDTVSPSEEGVIEFMNVDMQASLRPEKITLPKWYKDMPVVTKLFSSQEIPDLTIKRCIPILDALTTGYYLVTTEDYVFSKNSETGEYMFQGPKEFMEQKAISMHPTTQIETIKLSPEYLDYAFKWSNSWLIKTPPGYSCLFTHPLSDAESPFTSLDAIVDTDNFFMPVLFPFLMKNNFEGTIPAGTPVIQIIPFKRTDWTMKINKDFNDDLGINYQAERKLYESGRYAKDGTPIGGMYKRDYRVKKKYR